jgi:hypothetical protein
VAIAKANDSSKWNVGIGTIVSTLVIVLEGFISDKEVLVNIGDVVKILDKKHFSL